jgi:hypothetical protein
MFAVLLRFTLSFVYNVYIVYILFENMAVQQPQHVYIFNHDIQLKHSEYFLVRSQFL